MHLFLIEVAISLLSLTLIRVGLPWDIVADLKGIIAQRHMASRVLESIARVLT